jgi:hypothetical protein
MSRYTSRFAFWSAIGLVLFSLSGKAQSDRVVARVGDIPIPMSYVYQKIEALPLGDQLKYREDLGRFIESVIREEMLFQYALSQVLAREPSLREAVKTLVVEKLVEHEVRSKVTLTQAQVRAYYSDNPDGVRGEHWRVSHIPLRSRQECDELMPTLTSEAALIKAARSGGIVPALAARSGDMGYFMRHHNVLGLGELVFQLSVKEPFVFENEDGCHIMWVSEHVDPAVPSFEEVAPRLEAF